MFAFAMRLKTDHFTDITYALTFLILALGLLYWSPMHARQLLLAALITLWALRLGGYLLYRITKIGKDDRFDGRREDFVRFLSFWTFQAIVIWITMIPATMALSSDAQPGKIALDYLGVFVALAGLLIEAVSDQQKFRFKNDPANRDRWIETGLWRYSRHPNYFGETLFWLGIFALAARALPPGWAFLIGLSPLFIAMMLLFVSGIPLLDEKAIKRFGHLPAFREYRKRTSVFVPWFVKS